MPKAKRTNGTDKLDDPTRWKKGKKDVEYTVEAIINKRTKGDNTEYLLTQDTWEPQDHLTGCKDLLQEYKAHNHDLIARHRILPQQHGNSHVCTTKRKRAR